MLTNGKMDAVDVKYFLAWGAYVTAKGLKLPDSYYMFLKYRKKSVLQDICDTLHIETMPHYTKKDLLAAIASLNDDYFRF